MPVATEADAGDAGLPETIDGVLDALEQVLAETADIEELAFEEQQRYWNLKSQLIDLINEDLDEDAVTSADKIWWNDECEFHFYCRSHYNEIADQQWSGFTTAENPQQIREVAQERLEDGALCEKCHYEVLYDRRDELLQERGLA